MFLTVGGVEGRFGNIPMRAVAPSFFNRSWTSSMMMARCGVFGWVVERSWLWGSLETRAEV